ncbi:MAG: hypothetical protein ACLTSG_14905 [Lachnospiraceae bacterium]
MSTSSNLDRICVAALALAVLIAALAFCAPALGYEAASGGVVLGYFAERLGAPRSCAPSASSWTGWEGYPSRAARDEAHVLCDLAIAGGESSPGAGIRAKGQHLSQLRCRLRA